MWELGIRRKKLVSNDYATLYLQIAPAASTKTGEK